MKYYLVLLAVVGLALGKYLPRKGKQTETGKRTIGKEFVFAIPHMQHEYDDETVDKNLLTFINDAAETAEVTVKYERSEAEVVMEVEPVFYARMALPYDQAGDNGDNSATLTNDVVTITSTEDITVIFEQVFQQAAVVGNNPQDKAMLVLPTWTLGTTYTVPTIGNGPTLISAAKAEEENQNVALTSIDGAALSITKMPTNRVFQNQLPGFNGADVTASPEVAVQVAGGTTHLDMIQSDQTMGKEYAVGPGAYRIYATVAPAQVQVNGRLVADFQAKGEFVELLMDADPRLIVATENVLVMFVTTSDWASLPSLDQYAQGGDILFTGLNGKASMARIVIETELVGSVLLNSRLIPTSSWGFVDEEEKYSYVDVPALGDLNRVSTRKFGHKFNVLVFSDVSAYVPTYLFPEVTTPPEEPGPEEPEPEEPVPPMIF